MPETYDNIQERFFGEFRGEIRGMRDDFRKVSTDMGILTEKVNHLVEALEKTETFGERIKAVETEVTSILARMQSADTERRWVIALLVTVGVTLLGRIFKVVP